MFFSGNEIDRLISEDVPYLDLTGKILGIGEQTGSIRYFTREGCVVCGTEVVNQIFRRLDIRCEKQIASGTRIPAGAELIIGSGPAEQLHIAWKACQNILDHCSGIATTTRRLVDAVHAVNPQIAVLTTRKGFPGTKKLATQSILAGGAVPHRLGLSETILIFEQHMNFIGGFAALLDKLPLIRRECCEKKIIVEATGLNQAEQLCGAGVDGIQFDKLTPGELQEAATVLKEKFPSVTLLAAGGIRIENAGEYARAGIDGIVTTSLYSAPPVDIGVDIRPV